MPYTVFTKLYESLVQPILLYGSAVWGLSEQRHINNVQNRAAKLFLGVNRRTSNIGAQGDLGWLSCIAKQRLEVLRYFHRINSYDDCRIVSNVLKWSKRKRRSWSSRVLGLLSVLVLNTVLNESKEQFMIMVKSKIKIQDEQIWFSKLWNDDACPNGNKLRHYRKFKKDLKPDFYVTSNIPRHLRSYISKLRCGTLPLTVETGRYSKPPTPLEDRTCPFCTDIVEDEIHFLINCKVYSDLRFTFFQTVISFNETFESNTDLENFLYIIQLDALQLNLATLIYKMIRRRRALLTNI